MCRVTGFVAKPEAARKKGGQDYFFVNGRYMKHPYFHKAVLTAYERLIPEGMQPPYFLYFDINPADIDVNIHPTKTEIKFENEQAIWQLLVAVVRDALGKFIEIPSIDFDTVDKPDIPVFDPSSSPLAPKVTYDPSYNPFERNKEERGEWKVERDYSAIFNSKGNESYPGNHQGHSQALSQWESLYPSTSQGISSGADHSSFLFPPSSFHSNSPTDPNLDASPTHYQYKGRYIMTAVKSGLMVIDQHRASVRIFFDRYATSASTSSTAPATSSASAASAEGGTAPAAAFSSQRLLFPETLQLAPSEAVLMDQILPELATLGFDLSPLGGGTFAVNGIPAGMDGVDPLSLVQQILADVADHDAQSGAASQSLDLSVTQSLHLSLARAAAIPYGQVLSNDEMESLVNTLFTCSNVNYTPDGSPILVILPQSDIDSLFSKR